MPHDAAEALLAIADRVDARQEHIVSSWRAAVDADPRVSAAASLSRVQFRDHVPQLLRRYAERLRHLARGAPPVPLTQQDIGAAHGVHRWQLGYGINEVMREWGHLQVAIAGVLHAYAREHPALDSVAMAEAFSALAQVCAEGIAQATEEFTGLKQTEAAGQARDLQSALEDAQRLQLQQGEMLHSAAHDLRGHLGIVTNAATLLTHDALTGDRRDQLVATLRRAIDSHTTLLGELMELARLQAGQERRRVAPFDAGARLTALVAHAQPLAQSRGLTLVARGPASLPVTGDALKVARIVQNLLLNALAYTVSGEVQVAWGDCEHGDAARWKITVVDSGPGFHVGAAAPLAGALHAATADPAAATGGPRDEAPPPAALPMRHGEGIGLSIVKRLCELLDAGIEWESEPGRGTTVRVLLPRRYSDTQ